LWGLGLTLILAVFRIPWIQCDAGVPALWDYGYFCTDEGYYTYGGKCAYLTGRLINTAVSEPLTLTFAPLQHILAFLSFKCFGLNGWAHRVPVLLAGMAAWILIYTIISRRTLAWLAFMAVAIFSCNPISLVYERTASTDVLMGAFAVIAFFFALGQSIPSALLSALALALAYFSKSTAVGIAPLIILTFLTVRPWRWSRIIVFVAALSFLITAGRVLLVQHISTIAQQDGLVADELLKLVGRAASLPTGGTIAYYLKALASFPRWTTAGILGGGVVLAVCLPMFALMGRIFMRPWHWGHRVVLYFGIVLYAAGVACGNQLYARYFVPMMFFVPLIVFEARRDMSVARGVMWRSAVPFVLAVAVVYEIIFWLIPLGTPGSQALAPYFSNHHNLPSGNLWVVSWRIMIPTALVMFLATGWFRGWKKERVLYWIGAALMCIAVAHFGATGLPLFRFGFQNAQADLFLPTLLTMHGMLLVFAMFWMIHCEMLRRWKVWFSCFGVLLALSWLSCASWREGSEQLMTRQWTRRNAEAALGSVLPKDAIVFGERSLALFIGSAATTGVGASDLTIKRLVQQNPGKVFVILDQVQHYLGTQLAQNKVGIKCRIVYKIPMPAFHNGMPMDCYVGQLDCPVSAQ
jgi:hypothetical protein